MPAGHPGLRWFTLLLSAVAVAQQQQPQDGSRYRSSPPENSVLQPRTLKHTSRAAPRVQVEVPHGRYRDTDASPIHTPSGNNERAIATLAPVDSHSAVRAPHPARSAAGSDLSGLRSRNDAVARSLRDWEVEDLVLLATIDGRIHAVDRKTGKKEKWVFPAAGEPSRPIVNTQYHQRNLSSDDATIPADEWLWIVEPTQDGALYIYKDNALQKIAATVKTLTDLSTFASIEEPFVIYTAKKDSTLYTLNAATGKMIREVSSDSATFGFDTTASCKPVTGFEGLDDEECESRSHFMIARTDYTVVIRNQSTLEALCTIRYSEWSANGRDQDLADQYHSTVDNTYILSGHDGRFTAVDYNNVGAVDDLRTLSQNKLSAPVVRVFDVARHTEADPKEATLVILPQPSLRLDENDGNFNIFVNCTESGGWYAMSEQRYPFVTSFAKPAQCYANLDAWSSGQFWAGDAKYSPRKWELIGKHALAESDDQRQRNQLTISAPWTQSGGQQQIRIDASNETKHILIGDLGDRSWLAWLKSWMTLILTGLALPVLAFIYITKQSKLSTTDGGLLQPIPESAEQALDAAPFDAPAPIRTTEEPERKVRFVVPEPSEKSESAEPSPITEPGTPGTEGDEDGPESANLDVNGAADTPKKKKAHRGQRGGKKRKKKTENTTIEEGLTEQIGRQIDPDHSMKPDEITATGGSSDVSMTVILNNLEVYKDRPLGYGSGGTVVFEGKKGNRVVAVKQIMPQYMEVASQEVALLEQSDDHPNVIRYFDNQRDRDFIYIALEPCQASLYDLYKDGGSRDGLSDERLQLVSQINSNIPNALLQLSDGMSHLHKLRLIHRDIKPQNILVAYPKKHETGGPRLVISDFGLCKTLPDNASTLVGTAGNAGTIGWKAPELIGKLRGNDTNHSSSYHSQKEDNSSSTSSEAASGVKRAVDIFSLGCVFFYVLTNGGHPFDGGNAEAWTVMRELNIKEDRRDFSKLEALGPDRHEPEHLLSWMLEHRPEHRPTALQVKHHPFFWSPSKRLTFLCEVSDHFEREPREPPSYDLEGLESKSDVVIPNGDFLARLDRKFVDTLGKQRKYQGHRMLDLLRALRNKKNHYADMPEDVKQRVGPLSGGYLSYWTNRFPELLVKCYDVLDECGLQRDPRFVEYMGCGES